MAQAGTGIEVAATYHALPAPTRRLLRLLGLHPGAETSLAAAAALAGLGCEQAQPLLRDLVRARLIDPVPAGPRRYRIPGPVGAYARELTRDEEPAEEIRVARRRVLWWYLHGSWLASRQIDLDCRPALDLARNPALVTAAARHQAPTIPDPRAAREWYEREWTNLLAAAEAAAEHGFPDVLWQLAATLRYAQLRADRVEAGLAVQQAALASTRRKRNRHAEAVTLDSLSVALARLGRRREAQEANRAAIALWHLQGDRPGEAQSRLTKMRLLVAERDWPHAVPTGWTIVAAAESLGEGRLEAATLGLLAECYAETARYEEARLLLHEAVALYRARPWAPGLADALWNTSRVLRWMGRPAAALGPARDALAQAEITAHGPRECRTLLELALVWQANGRAEKALAVLQQATARARLCGDRGSEARALSGVAGYYREAGDLSAAYAFDQRATDLAGEIGDDWQRAVALEQAAETLDRLGQSVAARRTRQQAYALFEQFDEPQAHRARGRLSAALGADPPPTLGRRQARTGHDGGE